MFLFYVESNETKLTRDRLLDTENEPMAARGRGRRWVKNAKGNKVKTSGYRTNKSQGCN